MRPIIFKSQIRGNTRVLPGHEVIIQEGEPHQRQHQGWLVQEEPCGGVLSSSNGIPLGCFSH